MYLRGGFDPNGIMKNLNVLLYANINNITRITDESIYREPITDVLSTRG
jgi:hypothetical protein